MENIIWAQAAPDTEGDQGARTLFTQTYGYQPFGVWSAPGRVNIIGEHVDYNGGMCLPIALPHRAYLALSPRKDRLARLISPRTRISIDTIDLDNITAATPGEASSSWTSYIVGVAWALEQAGYGPLPGFDAALWSCVPMGAGLSSSAALECAASLALSDIAGLSCAGAPMGMNEAGRRILAAASCQAENTIVGAPTGGLDQHASLLCRAGNALALNCVDMSARHIPFDLASYGLELLVIDTRVTHDLRDGNYGKRRRECGEAARILGVEALGELNNLEVLDQLHDATLVRRARHVISEIARTRALIDTLESGTLTDQRLTIVGALLNDSHDSLRDDYEVSCPQLDTAVEIARAMGACGARMTGGGFGGSAIALVSRQSVREVAGRINAYYLREGWERPHFIRATPSGAAQRER